MGEQSAQLYDCLKQHPHVSTSIIAIIMSWIHRCEGFLFDTELIAKDITIKYLISKSHTLLTNLPKNSTTKDVCEIFAYEFEGLYFHSWGRNLDGSKCYWNSTQESYEAYKTRLMSRPLNHYADKPHLSPELTKQWLLTQVKTEA